MTGTLTLRDPSANGALDDLVMAPIVSGSYNRANITQTQLKGYTLFGRAQINTQSRKQRYQWSVFARLPLVQWLLFEEYLAKQEDWHSRSIDQFLTLVDEIDYVYPMPPPHDKTLKGGSVVAQPNGSVYGYGIFKIKLIVPENYISDHVRDYANPVGENITEHTIQFQALELPDC